MDDNKAPVEPTHLHTLLLCLVQLEDDIVARPNFFTTMKNFALQQPLEDWMILEFSQLGFIGLYRHDGRVRKK